MKNTLIALAFVAFMFNACTTEVATPVTVSLSKTSLTDLTLVNSSRSITIMVSNGTDKEASIMWERSETQSVSGWTYAVSGSTAANGTLTIPANSAVSVNLVVNPNNNAGTGAGTLKFYDSADQAVTMKTFTYSLTTTNAYFTITAPGLLTNSVRANDPDTDYHLSIYNPNTTDITVTWERTAESANPSPWQVVVCTDLVCWTPTTYKETALVQAGATVDFKATISHNATTGTGGMTPLFYMASDSANSAVNNYVIDHTVTQ